MATPIEVKKDFFDELISKITQLKIQIADSTEITSKDISGIKDTLNKIFDDKTCIDCLYTENTDNVFFGINVDPTITNVDLMNILIETEEMELDRYMIEIDSKILNILDSKEIASYMIEEISNIMYPNAITQLRAYIDSYLTEQDDAIDLKNSVNYNGLLIFAFKDTLRKLTSLLYKLRDPDKLIGVNSYAHDLDTHEPLVTAATKLNSTVFGTDIDVEKPDLSELAWVFNIYRNMSTEYKDALTTLEDAKALTGSQLQKQELDKAKKSIIKAAGESINEQTTLFESKKQSIFQGLKKDGLRSIEEAIYEYKVRIRNCDDADEALYILRCINANITILENYLEYTGGISDSERERWQMDINAYRDLRIELSKKRFNRPTFYGIDYSRYDALDRNSTNTPSAKTDLIYPYM